MKPMIGLIRSLAKAGITIPAAPRMTSASLKPEVENCSSIHVFVHVSSRWQQRRRFRAHDDAITVTPWRRSWTWSSPAAVPPE
jgi:hypothetical protein